MKANPILNIKIDMDGPSVQLKAENGEVVMIPFRGSVKSELFTGIVEPCGVDTQVVNAAGVRHMSARYMLTGKDKEGQDAHIPSQPFTQTAKRWRRICTGISLKEKDGWKRTGCIFIFMRLNVEKSSRENKGELLLSDSSSCYPGLSCYRTAVRKRLLKSQ